MVARAAGTTPTHPTVPPDVDPSDVPEQGRKIVFKLIESPSVPTDAAALVDVAALSAWVASVPEPPGIAEHCGRAQEDAIPIANTSSHKESQNSFESQCAIVRIANDPPSCKCSEPTLVSIKLSSQPDEPKESKAQSS